MEPLPYCWMLADSLPNPPRYPGEAKGNKRQSIHNSVQDPVAGKCQISSVVEVVADCGVNRACEVREHAAREHAAGARTHGDDRTWPSRANDFRCELGCQVGKLAHSTVAPSTLTESMTGPIRCYDVQTRIAKHSKKGEVEPGVGAIAVVKHDCRIGVLGFEYL